MSSNSVTPERSTHKTKVVPVIINVHKVYKNVVIDIRKVYKSNKEAKVSVLKTSIVPGKITFCHRYKKSS